MKNLNIISLGIVLLVSLLLNTFLIIDATKNNGEYLGHFVMLVFTFNAIFNVAREAVKIENSNEKFKENISLLFLVFSCFLALCLGVIKDFNQIEIISVQFICVCILFIVAQFFNDKEYSKIYL